MAKIADPRDIIIAPVISEKSYGLIDENKYTFLVIQTQTKLKLSKQLKVFSKCVLFQ